MHPLFYGTNILSCQKNAVSLQSLHSCGIPEFLFFFSNGFLMTMSILMYFHDVSDLSIFCARHQGIM
jgi:hypothetical protein